jgi:hypothetical protein
MIFDSYKTIRERHGSEMEGVLKQLAMEITSSGNAEAHGYFDDLKREMEQPSPNKSKLEAARNSILSAFPGQSKIAKLVAAVAASSK